MNVRSYIQLAILILCGLGIAHSEGAKLRFDGLYQVRKEKEGFTYYKYLRFFADGTVIGVSSVGDPSQIREWFKIGNPNVSAGTVTESGGNIRFQLKSAAGIVRYAGIASINKLTITGTSEIDGSEVTEIYLFMADRRTGSAQPLARPAELTFVRADAP